MGFAFRCDRKGDGADNFSSDTTETPSTSAQPPRPATLASGRKVGPTPLHGAGDKTQPIVPVGTFLSNRSLLGPLVAPNARMHPLTHIRTHLRTHAPALRTHAPAHAPTGRTHPRTHPPTHCYALSYGYKQPHARPVGLRTPRRTLGNTHDQREGAAVP